MHRIDEEGSTPQNGFTDGDVQTGTEATTVGADFMNSVQEEIAGVIEAAGIVLDKNDNGQLLQALGGGGGGGLKNLLINGAFNVTERLGAVGSNHLHDDSLEYAIDRWIAQADGSGGAGRMLIQQAGANVLNSRIGSAANNDLSNQTHYCFLAINTAATVADPYIEQRAEFGLLESVGRPLTFSIYINAPAGVTGSLQISQHFGDGGGASAEVVFATKEINPGAESTYRRFSVTGTPPVIDGKTINGTPSIRVRWTPFRGQVVGYHEMTVSKAQLEYGESPSGFDHRPYSVERLLAARYFEKSWHDFGGTQSLDASFAYVAAGSTPYGLGDTFVTGKRVLPTVIWHTTDKFPGSISWGGSLPVTGSTGAGRRTTGHPICTPNGPLGLAAAHWTADAEI